MSVEILRQIRKQEEEAEKIRRDALAESKRIVNTAKEDAAVLIERAKAESDANYKKTMENVNQEILTDYEKTIQHARGECDMLLARGKKMSEKAVSTIVRRVVSGWQS